MHNKSIVLALLLASLLSHPVPADPVGPRAEPAPALGVRVTDLEPWQLEDLKLEYGVKVVSVTPGTAAEAAGLASGDVIVELAGRPVYATARLRHLVAGLEEGDKFEVVYLRDGRKATASAQFKHAPQAGPAPRAAQTPYFGPFTGLPFFSRHRLGVQLHELTEDLRATFGVDSGVGVLVAEVLPDSPAKKADVMAGDVIVRLDRRTIRRISDVHRALSCFEPGEEATLSVIRDKKPLILTVKLEAADERSSQGAPHTTGREFLENLEGGLRKMFGDFGEPAGPSPGWSL